jgi:ribosomal protein S18 acetylase RimI-like enzyme
MKINIRPATISDVDDLVAIMNDALHLKLSRGDNAWGTEPYTRQDIEPYIPRGFDYIATIDGTPAGRIVIRTDADPSWGKRGNDDQAGYLHSLATKAEYRGQGLGITMISWATAHLKNQGKTKVRLDCPANNIELCNYYEQLGFKKAGMNDGGFALFEKMI